MNGCMPVENVVIVMRRPTQKRGMSHSMRNVGRPPAAISKMPNMDIQPSLALRPRTNCSGTIGAAMNTLKLIMKIIKAKRVNGAYFQTLTRVADDSDVKVITTSGTLIRWMSHQESIDARKAMKNPIW